MVNVLLIEDNKSDRAQCIKQLEEKGFAVKAPTSMEELERIYADVKGHTTIYEVLVLDLNYENWNERLSNKEYERILNCFHTYSPATMIVIRSFYLMDSSVDSIVNIYHPIHVFKTKHLGDELEAIIKQYCPSLLQNNKREYHIDNIDFYPSERRIVFKKDSGKKSHVLTPTQSMILELLFINRGSFVTYDQIAQYYADEWDFESDNERNRIQKLISRLKNDCPELQSVIQNSPGRGRRGGYRIG